MSMMKIVGCKYEEMVEELVNDTLTVMDLLNSYESEMRMSNEESVGYIVAKEFAKYKEKEFKRNIEMLKVLKGLGE